MGRVLVVLLLVAALIGGFVWWLKRGAEVKSGLHGLAATVPEHAQVFVALDLRDRMSTVNVSSALKQAGEKNPTLGKQIAEAEKELGVTAQELSQWITPALAVALIPLEGQSGLVPTASVTPPFHAVLVAPVLNEDQARDSLRKILDKHGKELKARQSTEDGIPMWLGGEGPQGWALALHKQHLVLATSPRAVKSVTMCIAGKASTLAEHPQFREAQSKISPSSSAMAYASVKDALGSLGEVASLRAHVDDDTVKGIKSIPYLVYGVAIGERGPDAIGFLKLDAAAGAPLVKALLDAPSDDPQIAQFFPAKWGQFSTFDGKWAYHALIALARIFPEARFPVDAIPVAMSMNVGFRPEDVFTAVDGQVAMSSNMMQILPATMTDHFSRARAQGQVTACKSNLKNIRSALEMFSTDHAGRFPARLAEVTPKYLKSLPTCPAAGSETCSSTYKGGQAYYFACGGHHHAEAGVAANKPSYDSEVGLDEGAHAVAGTPDIMPTYVFVAYLKDEAKAKDLLQKLLGKAGVTPAVKRTVEGNEIHGVDGPQAVRWTMVKQPRTALLFAFGAEADARLDDALKSPAQAAQSIAQIPEFAKMTGQVRGKLVSMEFADLSGLTKAVEQMLENASQGADADEKQMAAMALGAIKKVNLSKTFGFTWVEPDGIRQVSNGYASTAVVGVAAIAIPNFVKARAMGQATACKSNLKNIGTALEMYSTDNLGKYPQSLDNLKRNYLTSIPTCPAAKSDTYSGSYVAVFPDRYTVVCSGLNHGGAGLPANYPQYTTLHGLIEK